MIKYENECVDCPPEMGCLGIGCPNREVPHLYCDRCDADCEELYILGNEQVCEECLKDNFERITL